MIILITVRAIPPQKTAVFHLRDFLALPATPALPAPKAAGTSAKQGEQNSSFAIYFIESQK